jgi:DNA invertase Pin-like site-specific DNA recombinase
MHSSRIPAAQYLRMSTDQQQYSLMNQAAAILGYAERSNFVVVKTYEDAGRSGLVLRERPGLRALLKDVVAHDVPYKAVLVYDVSRWGRFQDSDEAAAYEFLCKSAGIPVHYCAEQFRNDSSIPSSIMKALKRAMAAEFSRELGVKSYEGQKRLAQLGFKMGGRAGYGLRRMLLSSAGKPMRMLSAGEYKSVSSDRVVLVPGPKAEIEIVRRIYAMALKGMCPASIARELNRSKTRYLGELPWTFYVVWRILRHQKYAGWNVWGQTSKKLHGCYKQVPQKDWVTKAGAFMPVIDQNTFQRVQRMLEDRTVNKSDAVLINGLKRLWRREGRLSESIIDKSRSVPTTNTYCRRFGSLREAYRLAGYRQWDEYFQRREKAVRTEQLREKLVRDIAEMFPASVCPLHAPPKRRRSLVVDGRIVVSVYLCRSTKWPNGRRCWRFDPVAGETHNVTLLCTSNARNDGVENFYLFRSLGRTGSYKFGPQSKWLAKAKRLTSISDFRDAVRAIDPVADSKVLNLHTQKRNGAMPRARR